ncbi:MAG TPA: helix-turn-helix transcriptional regulator [Candidatus Acidoferrales bacterium]|jgi:predicted XRE-type DNA-binding protein|nr:helix-turn-helix transcriptional regulator [Candidatus Acidoferrales bacterium]
MPAKANKPSHVTKGNVFDDLGFSDEDAAALKIKAGILSALLDHIRRRRYTQKQLAELLGEYQPNISNLLNGKISTMSIEKLLNYAHRLNMDAQITMKMRPRSTRGKKARIA